MPPLLQTYSAGLLCAGNGSRLVDSLIELGEVERISGEYRFTANGELFEKSLAELVPANPNVPGDQGVVALDLSIKDVLLIPTVRTIRFLINERSNIPRRFGKTINRAEFLRRLGLPELQGQDIAPTVRCEYIEQPPRSDAYPYYGTAWAFHLVSQGVKLGEHELLMIMETDSAFSHPQGASMPAAMLTALQHNHRGATAAINVAPLPDDVTYQNGLGLVLMERGDDEYYFRRVIESQEHGNVSQALTSGFLHGKNTTRIAADAKLLAINEATVNTPPRAANNHEYQATDTYNDYGHSYPFLAYNNPAGIVWHDMGRIAGLLEMRKLLNGLHDAEHPVWHKVPARLQALKRSPGKSPF